MWDKTFCYVHGFPEQIKTLVLHGEDNDLA